MARFWDDDTPQAPAVPAQGGGSFWDEAPAKTPPQKPQVNAPRFPGVEEALQQYAGPLATAIAGVLTGGQSLAAQGLIGAGTEAAGQLLGGRELDPGAIALAGAVPGGGRAAGQAFQGIARGAAKLTGKPQVVEAGIQKAEQLLGKAATDAEFDATSAAAKAITTPVAQANTGRVVSDILSKKGRVEGVDQNVFELAEGMVRNAHTAASTGKPIQYRELFESATNMQKLANSAKGHDKEAYLNLRKAMLEDLAQVSPEASNAVAAYRKKASINDITQAMRGSNVAKDVADVLADPMLKGVFNETQRHTIDTIAKQIGNTGIVKLGASVAPLAVAGLTHPGTAITSLLAPAIMGALVSTPKVGLPLAKTLIGPEGKVNRMALPALAQLLRGYMAQEGNE